MSTTDSFVGHRLDQSYEMVTAAKTSSFTSFFSLPIELRIDIYERVLDSKPLGKSINFADYQRKSDKKRKRLLENIENIKKHGTCYDRRDLFVQSESKNGAAVQLYIKKYHGSAVRFYVGEEQSVHKGKNVMAAKSCQSQAGLLWLYLFFNSRVL
ncbi:hypothetical protein D6D04_09823 [Aureobasidium pullulans]|nr:hypothetical protein D6D04_09823 [Aureobasidium pullulans]